MKFDVGVYINGEYVPYEDLHLYTYRSANVDRIMNAKTRVFKPSDVIPEERMKKIIEGEPT